MKLVCLLLLVSSLCYSQKVVKAEEPLHEIEIARAFLNRDSLVRGWKMTYENVFRAWGYTEGIQKWVITQYNPYSSTETKTWQDTLVFEYGMVGKVSFVLYTKPGIRK